MNRRSGALVWGVAAVLPGLAALSGAHADALSAVQVLRLGGCGGLVPAAQPLRHDARLDAAAAQWAAGKPLGQAAESRGFGADSTAGVHVSGTDAALLEILRRADCRIVTDRSLREVGAFRSGRDNWVVLAATYAPPAGAAAKTLAPSPSWPPARTAPPAASTSAPRPQPARAPAPASGAMQAARALELVNDVRARGTRCGSRSFAPAPPVSLSGALSGVAFGHAADMAAHDYFEHQDLAGHSPADRVRAVGYHEKLVGENIAYGPASVEEVVQGWLDSPGHCENLMDPRFAQMGIGSAAGQAARRGLFWVQLLAEPRS
ncbi:MAG TPA: CAP domain-containing protein [Steroidobacteraceae bacterium]|nr:CAP domain-containing protein [Steroidobacteraceae bacterium]